MCLDLSQAFTKIGKVEFGHRLTPLRAPSSLLSFECKLKAGGTAENIMEAPSLHREKNAVIITVLQVQSQLLGEQHFQLNTNTSLLKKNILS